MWRYLLAIPGVLVTSLIYPSAARAQDGFVTCEGTPSDPCDLCHVVQTSHNILEFLVIIAVVIVILVIVYAGFQMAISAGNVQAKEDAKKYLVNGILGLILVLAAWLIVDTLMKIVVDEDVQGKSGQRFGVWHEIVCQSQPPVQDVRTTLPADDFDIPGRLSAARAAELGIDNMENVDPAQLAAGPTDADIEARVQNIQNSGDVEEMARAAAQEAGLSAEEEDYYVALVQQESSMCQLKTGPQTRHGRAYGCSQMLLSTARGLDPSATPNRLVNDDAYSLTLGAQYFSSRLDMYGGDTTRALAAYNGGTKANNNSSNCPGQLAWQCTANSGYRETRNYVASIDGMVARMR